MMRVKHIFLGVMLGCGIAIAGSQAPGLGITLRRANPQGTPQRQDRVQNGNYAATLAGSLRGTGVAKVTDNEISIQVSVTDERGQTGQLVAENLAVNGPYFSGSGAALGKTLTIRGRLDAVRRSRLTGMIFITGGGGCRIVANLPAEQDPPSDNWNDDDNKHDSSDDHPHHPH